MSSENECAIKKKERVLVQTSSNTRKEGKEKRGPISSHYQCRRPVGSAKYVQNHPPSPHPPFDPAVIDVVVVVVPSAWVVVNVVNVVIVTVAFVVRTPFVTNVLVNVVGCGGGIWVGPGSVLIVFVTVRIVVCGASVVVVVTRRVIVVVAVVVVDAWVVVAVAV